MQFQFRSPRNPLEWAITILAVGVVTALAFVAAAFAIVIVGVAILAAPVLRWWQRRKGTAPPSGTPPAGGGPEPGPASRSEGGRRVLDVEFEVEEKP